jgi:predicted DNA-binding transcriptional regulator AlpA
MKGICSMANQSREYLTLPEVAEHYRTTEGTVRYWRHTGYGPKGVKLGTRVLYPRAEVERFDRQLADQAAAASA